MKLTYFLFLTFFYNSLSAQYSSCYYYWTAKASAELFESGNCQKAVEYYQKAFNIQPNALPEHYWGAALSHACIEDNILAFFYLKEAMKNGYEWKNILNNSYLGKLRSKKIWVSIQEEYNILRKKYLDSLNIEVYSNLVEMYSREQFIRRVIFPKDKNHNSQYIDIVDSLNMTNFLKLIDKFGFPNFKEIGYQGRNNLYLILLHGTTNNEWAWEILQPILKKEINTGNILPIWYANFVDRRRLWGLKENQWYGSYNVKSNNTISKIENIKEVDQRRLPLGLLPLIEYMQYKKINTDSLPSEYKPINLDMLKYCK